MSDKIRPQHLERKAVLYIRQSSPGQVVQNQESQRLQYAMVERLRELGWGEVEVIDEDLGRSAAGLTPRAGFERMVAEVCLGQVGAVAAREVSRFARNSREWQHLVEVCRMVDTVLIDQEAVYSPRLSNDRLLLGLKGSMNEYELDLLRQRAVEGRNEKARRGEFLASVPVGYLKTPDGCLEMDPDRRVQEAIRLVFRKVMELGAARAVLLWFLEQGLDLPVRRPGPGGWETVWKRPQYGTIQRFLTNPTYAGAYAYGKSEVIASYTGDKPVKSSRRRPRERWLALLPGHHEGYVRWEEFERIQEMLQSNAQKFLAARPGAAKRGSALLAGLLRCRRCGRKLMVGYTGAARPRVPRYLCRRGNLDNAEPKCISFGGLPVDRALAQALLRVVAPAAAEAARQAEAEQERQQDDVLAALERDLQAARFAADRAGRQFDAADPANRLVADELERRWDAALGRVRELEQRIEQAGRLRPPSPVPGLEMVGELARDLEEVWNHPGTEAQLKKRLVRTLIEEIVIDVDDTASEVVLAIHWRGGVHTELRVRRRRRGGCCDTSLSVIDAVRSLARICPDQVLAGLLNRHGLRTGRGNRWTVERVAALRSYHQIPNCCPDRAQEEGWMTLSKAAAALGVSPRTLRLAVERGQLNGEHPLGAGPWIFNRRDLETEGARRFVERVSARKSGAAIPAPGQSDLGFSSK
jgi:DNA invertase Pin-like site-specific DNA recombinase